MSRITRILIGIVVSLIGVQLGGVALAPPAAATGTTSSSIFVCQSTAPTGNCTAGYAIVYGQPMHLIANVIDSDSGCGFFHNPANCDAPNGQVQLFDGAAASPFTSQPLTDTGVAEGDRSNARFAYVGLSVGVHSITAKYGGDDEFAPSEYAFEITVTQATPSVAFNAVTPPSSVFGENVPLSVAVSPAGATGTIQFLDGTTAIGAPVALDGSGTATIGTTTLTVGDHFMKATFSGDGNFASANASNPFVHTVAKARVGAAATSSSNPSVWGQSVTFTITMTATPPGAGTPTGTVALKEGTGTPTDDVLLVNGQAQITITGMEVGVRRFQALYSGDANFAALTIGVINQTVNKADTTTALTSSGNPSAAGFPVTFKATIVPVAPGAGTPTGTVQFKDGSTNLGAPVPVAGGIASVVTSTLVGGPHSITAVYSGDTHFNPSTSALLTQTVSCDNNYTGTVSGNLNVPAGTSACLNSAHVTGWLIIPNGAIVSLTDSVINGQIVTSGNPRVIQICGSEIRGATSISNVTGLLLLGDPYDDNCAPNQFNSTVSLNNNTHGVELVGNKIYGATSITKNSGGPTEIGANTIYGRLTCTNNNPVATNNGHPNTVAAQYGECSDPTF